VPGKLSVVATPLGNLDDLAPRALAALRAVDLIACEDTRRTGRLLARHGIDRPVVSCHKFNEPRRVGRILELLREGRNVALVSDGGTPGVSDPGARLVDEVLRAGLGVELLPGPSAVTALLSVSGLDADRFVFDGFLPARAGERRRRLRELREEARTVVFFESPRRIRDTLRDVASVIGPRRIVLGRELTKLHESVLAGTPEEVLARLDATVRGEVAVAMAGAASSTPATAEAETERLARSWRAARESHPQDRRAALRAAARELGIPRAELYRRLAECGLERE
jgi:16S rRNA (cytidine1402-2'-O)-methyltransferase